uniref:chloroplast protein-transporting ATPase n=1 Tax=Physcomitrium patens TaxID=3218 RepID=A0A7I4C591_PHYPA
MLCCNNEGHKSTELQFEPREFCVRELVVELCWLLLFFSSYDCGTAAMAAHTMAALVSSELANISGHSSSSPTSSQSPLSRTSSTLTLSQSPSGASPSGFSYSGRLSDSNTVPGGANSGFTGRRRGFFPPRRGHEGRRREAGTVCAPRAGLGGFLGGIFKGADTGEAARQMYSGQVAQVNALEGEMLGLSDDELRARTSQLQSRSRGGESLDSLLPEAFAIVREASKRVLGLRPFDVQLIGGMVLHKGQIAEMRTGEGKTLVAVLPAFLNCLTGQGVHVVTVNDYLARRDCEWVGQVHRFLGLRVGLIQQGMTPEERRTNYNCDITYVTNSELGFDFLRDNLATNKEELVLRGFNFCVIDEVDSILIDEARTPLIISGSAEKPSERYIKAAKIASAFQRDYHYTVDEKQKSVLMSEIGYEAAEEILNVTDLYDPREQWASYIINAIKAKELFLKDVNYIVRGQDVMIVDEFTGRVMQGRRWSDGLHQAVEAKEGVKIQNETVTLASISYQNFFLQYPKLCGMTGTAATEVDEFEKIYKLKVTVVPTNKPMIRKVLNAKPENVEREAEIVAQSGRLGAVTIATNMAGRGTDIILGGNAEFMARLKLREMLMPRVVRLSDEEIPFQKTKKLPTKKTWKVNPSLFPCELSNDCATLAEEAVEAAVNAWGEKALPELEAEDRLSYACERGPTEDPVVAQLRKANLAILSEYKTYTDEEKKKVVAAGGLHVVGTERHESRRIDNQLRGRSGRQGDPGSTRFFLSLEDNIFRIFGGDRIQGLMKAFRVEDLPIESKMLTKSLDEAQKKVESYFFDIRKQLFEYDEVLNSQRDRVYTERRRALEATNLEAQMIEYAELTMDDILEANVDSSLPQEEWNLEALCAKVKQYCYLLEDLTPELLNEKCPTYDSLGDYLRMRGREAYVEKKRIVTEKAPGLMEEAERYFVLSQTDNLWKEHLQALKFVQQAVGLRGYAQRDPLIEYKLEGYNLFLEMMAQIRRNVIYSVYQFQPVMATPTAANGSSKKDSSQTKGKVSATAS